MTSRPCVNVLQVVRPAAGGIRQHVLQLLEYGDPARFSLSIAAPSEFLSALPAGATFADRYPLTIRARFSPLADVKAAAVLANLLRLQPPAVVHAHGLRAAFVAALAHRLHKFPLVVTAHNLIDPGAAARLGLAAIGSAASIIIAVSEPIAEGLRAHGVPSQKIVVIPNGVDIARYEIPYARAEIEALENTPVAIDVLDAARGALDVIAEARGALGVPPGAFVVAAIARLSPEKGIDVLLEAARLAPDLLFLIAGDGPLRAELSATAPPNARLLGRVDDVRTVLAAADAVAVPSRLEGQGIVALEAMASRRPVAASRVGGLAAMLTDGETALLVPAGDPAALAAALTRLAADGALRGRLAQAGFDLVKEHYDVRVQTAAVERVYMRLLDVAA